jgi:hypothetical protein
MDKGCIFLDSETILNFGDVKALLENQIWEEAYEVPTTCLPSSFHHLFIIL